MSRNQKTRSTLSLDAMATGSAALASPANPVFASGPRRNLPAIAALAGFVLRLFRSREQLPPAGRSSGQVPARIRPGSSQAVRRRPAPAAWRTKGGRRG